MNVIAEIQRINALELEKGLVGTSASWHTKYDDSAWVYVGNLPHSLTEGDVLCILSQWGEVSASNDKLLSCALTELNACHSLL
jgi:hypothetical protein